MRGTSGSTASSNARIARTVSPSARTSAWGIVPCGSSPRYRALRTTETPSAPPTKAFRSIRVESAGCIRPPPGAPTPAPPREQGEHLAHPRQDRVPVPRGEPLHMPFRLDADLLPARLAQGLHRPQEVDVGRLPPADLLPAGDRVQRSTRTPSTFSIWSRAKAWFFRSSPATSRSSPVTPYPRIAASAAV